MSKNLNQLDKRLMCELMFVTGLIAIILSLWAAIYTNYYYADMKTAAKNLTLYSNDGVWGSFLFALILVVFSTVGLFGYVKERESLIYIYEQFVVFLCGAMIGCAYMYFKYNIGSLLK